MITPLYYTRIIGGRFTSKPLRDLLAVDRDVEVFIRDRQEYPPEGLFRHYHGRLVPIVADMITQAGSDRPTMEQNAHKSLCRWFLSRDQYVAATDSYRLHTPSTRRLNWQQMQEFVHRVERWLTQDLEIKIPSRDAPFDCVQLP